MRYAGWLHPEWGYLAPAPSFLRTVRIALVSAAISAIVVISVVAHPGSDDDNRWIAHRLLAKAPAIIMPTAPAADPAQSQVRLPSGTANARSLAPSVAVTSTTNALAKVRDPKGTTSPTGRPCSPALLHPSIFLRRQKQRGLSRRPHRHSAGGGAAPEKLDQKAPPDGYETRKRLPSGYASGEDHG